MMKKMIIFLIDPPKPSPIVAAQIDTYLASASDTVPIVVTIYSVFPSSKDPFR